MGSGFVRRSGDDYTDAMASLLPTGPAWVRDAHSALMLLVEGLGQIWGVVDGRAADLLEIETDPRATSELLAEWERAFGLPETCGTQSAIAAPVRFHVGTSRVGSDALCHILPIARSRRRRVAPPQSIEDRRRALLNKITRQGGQSRAHFLAVAAALGYQITIREFSPFMVGVSRVGDDRPYTGSYRWFRCGKSRCGKDPHLDLPSDFAFTGNAANRLGPPSIRFVWIVNVAGFRLSWFRIGQSRLGVEKLLSISPRPDRFAVGASQVGIDPLLRISRADDLECVFRRWAPAHTEVVFNYGQVLQ